ncbi:hypothetical protein PsorP6_002610 [Peronosclerospora sorghi]|uniref:Uncharacterized protein n=1 Tax=Peronosclerospora sorghi TaxID=230839 RepID=A0ACC0WPY7_9STRA|nr:hypothetical protein PsorP6_002610 [Peronosclerospora sorghi]
MQILQSHVSIGNGRKRLVQNALVAYLSRARGAPAPVTSARHSGRLQRAPVDPLGLASGHLALTTCTLRRESVDSVALEGSSTSS